MNDTLLRQLELKAALRDALARTEFELVYQPVMNLWTGAIVGVEALLRWRHPTRGTVSPAEFVPLAEEIGEITQIGYWALREACQQIANLHRRTAVSLQVAINLSTSQLQDPGLTQCISAVLAETGLAPSALILEIAETAVMQDPESAIDHAHTLKTTGVRLAIDDFGAGQLSADHIRRFPADILKIDKSVVDGIGAQGEGQALTTSLIDLAATLKLRSVAEGIERIEQLDRLRELGCDFGQGYLFSAAVEAHQLDRLVSQGGRWPRNHLGNGGPSNNRPA